MVLAVTMVGIGDKVRLCIAWKKIMGEGVMSEAFKGQEDLAIR